MQQRDIMGLCFRYFFYKFARKCIDTCTHTYVHTYIHAHTLQRQFQGAGTRHGFGSDAKKLHGGRKPIILSLKNYHFAHGNLSFCPLHCLALLVSSFSLTFLDYLAFCAPLAHLARLTSAALSTALSAVHSLNHTQFESYTVIHSLNHPSVCGTQPESYRGGGGLGEEACVVCGVKTDG
jgi:hypothetical protein